MTELQNLIHGVRPTPPRIVLYGVHGIGKTTLAAQCPKPIFIPTEPRHEHIDCTRFPTAETLAKIGTYLDTVLREEHDFKTLVLDSADWAEKLIHQYVAKRNGAASIGDIDYGKGYKEGYEHWDAILKLLMAIWEKRKMMIVVIAHYKVESFSDPAGQTYDRYQLDMRQENATMLCEWCDCVFFANYKTFTQEIKTAFGKEIKGIGEGQRTIFTHRHAAYDAKNSYDLPAEMPFDMPLILEKISEYQAAKGRAKTEKPREESDGAREKTSSAAT